MTEEASAVSATRRSYRELADGTIRLQIDIDPPQRKDFLRLFPEIGMPIALAPLPRDFEQLKPAPAPVAKYGEHAKQLKLSGFFRMPMVWRAIGTDEQFREWVQKQPSVISGKFSEYVNGEGRNVAAHIRRANESGTALKADYCCVPMTNAEHNLQHHKGETEALLVHGSGTQLSPEAAKEWFEQQRVFQVERWAWLTLKAHLGVAHWNELHPGILCAWAKKKEVYEHLPHCYKNWNDDTHPQEEK